MEIKVNGQMIRLEVIQIHQIHPYENNVRIHPVRQLEGLANSISEFGFKNVIVVDKDNVIIAGHARYEAAAALGLKELLCVMADDLTEQQVNALRIVDNKIAEQGGTDLLALQVELAKIPNVDLKPFNIDLKKIDVKLPDITHSEDNEKAPVIIVCPRCDHEFTQIEKKR